MKKIITLSTQEGRNFLEIALPNAFIAIPITDAGISQIIADMDEIATQRAEEINQLNNVEI